MAYVSPKYMPFWKTTVYALACEFVIMHSQCLWYYVQLSINILVRWHLCTLSMYIGVRLMHKNTVTFFIFLFQPPWPFCIFLAFDISASTRTWSPLTNAWNNSPLLWCINITTLPNRQTSWLFSLFVRYVPHHIRELHDLAESNYFSDFANRACFIRENSPNLKTSEQLLGIPE